MLDFILSLIFPQLCIGCGKFNTLLCENCYEKINFYPLTVELEIKDWSLEEIIVMAQYEGVTKKLIAALKYQGVKDVSKTLADMIYLATSLPPIEAIAAVPLHSKRQRQRGFNQATEIALGLSRITQIPFVQLLQRTKHSQPQAKVSDKKKRLVHLDNTFAINQTTPDLESVLIVDDVITTGTTLNKCAQVLKQAGIKKIYGLVVAHGN